MIIYQMSHSNTLKGNGLEDKYDSVCMPMISKEL